LPSFKSQWQVEFGALNPPSFRISFVPASTFKIGLIARNDIAIELDGRKK